MSSAPGEPLSVSIDSREGSIVVTVSGSADMDQVDALAMQLRQAALDADEALILDLGGLSFICSGGLGALLQARNACQEHGLPLRLVAPSPAVMDVLHTTRLDRVLPIFATVDDAVAGS